MNRSEFLASLFGGAVAVKAVDFSAATKDKPSLLVFEYSNGPLSKESVAKIREGLQPFAERHNFEFIVLHGGLTLKAAD